MSTRRSFKLIINNEVVFRLEVAGSNDMVEALVQDVFFKGYIRDATRDVIQHKVKVAIEGKNEKTT